MNKLSFISSIPGNNDTYIYVLPTNSQKYLNLDEVSIKVHILDLRGNSLLVFPAASASSDGVCFTLSNLANLGSGTYAIYLELLYADHQEFYPNDSVKYITIKNDDKGNLVFANMFTADSSSIVPPQDTNSNLTDVLHVHDIDLKSIKTLTVPDSHSANVSLDQNDNLIFEIPRGATGDRGPAGPQGPVGPKGDKGDTGESAYQAWLDAGNTGSESQFLASLKGLKGDKGDTGPQGPQGIQGIQGPQGPVGPQGSRGYNFWAMKMTAGGNVSGRYITDLYSASASNLPEVNDLVVQPDGNVFSVTNVIKDTTTGAADGGGTFDLGPALFSIKGYKGDKGDTGATGPQGPKGDDAVIKVISQAEYDALADKSGVYFIGG